MSIIQGVDLEGITHRGDPCSHKRSIFACKSKTWHFQLLDRKNDDPHPSPTLYKQVCQKKGFK